ncbi:Rrf2 family transcriptional regulator [Candidatus Sumerlaeota bacterium]|nr:Rrf2 family transcriptional regulator [Candidatus Sumerlaeota bacterium]
MLSQTSQYALQAMYCIGTREAGSPIPAREIAETMGIPLRYLLEILGNLVRLGILRSTRGLGGGFQLARPASDIRLVDIVSPFQTSTQQTTCPFGHRDCGEGDPCPVHERWAKVVKSYQLFSETTTLEMIISNKQHR